MAWLKIQTAVARNRKFMKAGPGPSWLWVCGLAYCQDGLTDGFIPHEAIDYLGVKSARHLARHLISSGLWEEVEGGWRVHDYLDHNKSAAEIGEIRTARAEGGRLGGRPRKNAHEKPSVNHEGFISKTLPKTFAVAVAGDVAVSGAVHGSTQEERFERFWAAYPRKVGKDAAWREWLKRSPSNDLTGDIIQAVERDKASPQWRKDGGQFIPHPRTWLHQGRWKDSGIEAPERGEGRCRGDHEPPCRTWQECTRKSLEEARIARAT